MRIRRFLCCCVTAAACATANAQEPALPQPDTQDPPPAAPLPSIPQLLPDDILPAATPGPNAPSLPQLDEVFKDNPLTHATAEQRARIEWRKLRNAAINDPALKAARAEAEAAPTDLEKRKLLRRYYEMLYAKITPRGSTPEVRRYLNDRKNDHLNALPQPRVRPETVPPPAPPAPAGSPAQPTPSPTPQPSISPPTQILPLPTATPGAR